MLEFYVLAGKHEFNVSVPLLTSCVCVCRLVSSDIKEQGEECQKSFGHDGAMRHAAIHFESARTLGDPAQPAGHSHYHTLAYAQTSYTLPHRHTEYKVPCTPHHPACRPPLLRHEFLNKMHTETPTCPPPPPYQTETHG